MSSCVIGHCPTCGAPIYGPMAWMGVTPPPPQYSCGCAHQSRTFTTTDVGVDINVPFHKEWEWPRAPFDNDDVDAVRGAEIVDYRKDDHEDRVEHVAVIKDPGVGVRCGEPTLWFDIVVQADVAAFTLSIAWAEAYVLLKTYGVERVSDLSGKPIWVYMRGKRVESVSRYWEGDDKE